MKGFQPWPGKVSQRLYPRPS